MAYQCLQRIDHDGAYANLLLQSELGRSGLSERDRGFVTELVYGTTRMRRGCDALIDRFLIKEPQPALRTCSGWVRTNCTTPGWLSCGRG